MKLIETFHHLVLVWIQNAFAFVNGLRFLCGSRALFMGFASMDFNKFFFKTESHDIIHIFKNYFTTVFSVFRNKRYLNKSLVPKVTSETMSLSAIAKSSQI